MRYIGVDFTALCRRILELCIGAESIASYEKIEGVQAKTTLPIPSILDWSNDPKSSIKSEYIVMEHPQGVRLHEKWPDMAGDQKVKWIAALYETVKELVDLEYAAYGSLYFLDSLRHSGLKYEPLDANFCIGPHCGTQYWDCNTKTNLDEYSDRLIDASLARIAPTDAELNKRPSYHGSVQVHLDVLRRARSVLKTLCADPRIQAAATPVLFHPDLHKRNVFVSENNPVIIIAIIDWQSTSMELAFWYADDYRHPKLSRPRSMDENLFRPFRYSPRTWKDGIVALRHELIETSRSCENLGLDGTNPSVLHPAEELARHKKEYELFVAAQKLRGELTQTLNSADDGWVGDVFDSALDSILTNGDQEDVERVKGEEVLRAVWPFDLE
ncbi:hypothetical protein M501DRAFT_1024106 [Patellaria atrata CBS 101060]|uniref:Altered inheritance of mitochondria protein 9, mitochondrial n=1 Tax=Patellaria atrata CBS 101060 TaxID=1346257 RepID=A0A9P4SAE9_9PEZI|nr:hypothetical protein M501DRAFT_1024106 [Patellaria atrata CBS 101060]